MKKYIVKINVIIVLVAILISCSEDTIDAEGLGVVSGNVVAIGTNEPLENVKISTNPPTSTVFTDVDGIYTINNIPSGDYSISAQREGLLAQFEGISVITDKTLEVVFEMDIQTAGNKPPDAAVLEAPLDNAVDQPLEVLLNWSGSDPDDDDLTFNIILRNDENSNVEVFENITDTSFLLQDLMYNVKYFWQVTSNDGINTSVNSSVYVFETASPPNNRILYTRFVGDNSVIYSSSEEGDTEIRLTSINKNSFRPRRNPNTQTVAFLQSVGSQIHLFVMNEDGSQVKQVTSNVAVSGFDFGEIDYSWSDNGAKLLFPNQDKLYSVNVDGSGVSMIYQTSNGSLITEIDKNDLTDAIALKTNNLQGYDIEIFTINSSGVLLDTVLSGISGAAGSVNLSIDGTKLLYTYDVSGFENDGYRQLDTHMFVYNFSNSSLIDVSAEKPVGINDLDARFSPNDSEIIYVSTSNDGISQKNIETISITNLESRDVLIENATMVDWE